MGERIRRAIAAPETSSLSVSIGGSLFSPDQDLDSLLTHADQALYRAKAAGRNRYCAHDPSES